MRVPPLDRVDENPVYQHAEMKVIPSGHSRIARSAQGFSFFDFLLEFGFDPA